MMKAGLYQELSIFCNRLGDILHSLGAKRLGERVWYLADVADEKMWRLIYDRKA
jgi:hypothetical protein